MANGNFIRAVAAVRTRLNSIEDEYILATACSATPDERAVQEHVIAVLHVLTMFLDLLRGGVN